MTFSVYFISYINNFIELHYKMNIPSINIHMANRGSPIFKDCQVIIRKAWPCTI